jgi:predicted MFS family arabinose efflux permease
MRANAGRNIRSIGTARDAGLRQPDGRNHPLAVAAMVLLCAPGGITMVIAPVVLTAFVASGRLTAAQATTLGSAELIGMSVALVAASAVIARADRRALAVLGLLATFAGHLAAIQLADYAPLLGARFLAGLGEGLLTGVGVASIAGTASPDRNFGFAVTSNLVASAAFLAIAARLGPEASVGQVLTVVCGCCAVAALGLPWLPHRAGREAVRPEDGGSLRATLPAGACALAALLVFMAGIGAVWPLFSQITAARGAGPGTIATALALAGWAGISGGVAVSWVGARFGRIAPLVVVSAIIAAVFIALQAPLDGAFHVAAAFTIMFCWIASVPYFMGALAALDRAGRWVALGTAMQPAGFAAGQVLAAALVLGAGYAPTLTAGAGLVVFAALLLLAARHVELKLKPA